MANWSPEKIPIWLRRTPEQQAADQALQDRLRSAYGPGRRPNPTERHLMQARAAEVMATAHLEHYATHPHSNPQHIRTASAQLAEARAAQGHYNEASAIHPDPLHAARYAQIAAAVERPDDETCDCQPDVVKHPVNGKSIVLESDNVNEMVFDPRIGKLQSLVVCSKCGDMNVKPAPPQLQKRLNNQLQKEPT